MILSFYCVENEADKNDKQTNKNTSTASTPIKANCNAMIVFTMRLFSPQTCISYPKFVSTTKNSTHMQIAVLLTEYQLWVAVPKRMNVTRIKPAPSITLCTSIIARFISIKKKESTSSPWTAFNHVSPFISSFFVCKFLWNILFTRIF